MAQAANNKVHYSLEVNIASSTAQRSEAELRKDVNQALLEASRHFRKLHKGNPIQVQASAVGGFLGLGLAWPWVIHIGGDVLAHLIYKAGEGAAQELGKEGGQSLYTLFKEALRKRNLTLAAKDDLRLFPDPKYPLASLPPPPPRRLSRKKPKGKSKPRATRKRKARKPR